MEKATIFIKKYWIIIAIIIIIVIFLYYKNKFKKTDSTDVKKSTGENTGAILPIGETKSTGSVKGIIKCDRKDEVIYQHFGQPRPNEKHRRGNAIAWRGCGKYYKVEYVIINCIIQPCPQPPNTVADIEITKEEFEKIKQRNNMIP